MNSSHPALIISITIVVFLNISIFSFAEEIKLEPITIKKPQAEGINNIPFCSLEEIIDYSSSIDLRKRSAFGVQQDVSLRGSIFEDTAIALQGIKINDPQTGHFNLELPLTSADLERIDIFKNSQRINFIPKEPKEQGFLLGAGFGEHALWEKLVSWNFPLAQAKNRLSCEHKISKGGRQDTDFEIYNFSFHSLWEDEQKEKKIEFLFGSTKRDFGADSFYSSGYPHEEEHINQRFYSLLTELKEELFSLSSAFYLRRHSDKYILDRHNPSFYTNYHTTYVYGLKTQAQFNNGLFLSLNMDRENIDSTNLNKHYRLKKGLALGMKDKKIGRFILDFSAGFDYYEQWEYLENLCLGLGYFLSDELKLRFDFDRIWRAPSFTELYYVSPANRGSTGLEIQKSNNFEWGIDCFPNEALTSTLSFFLRDQSDTIDWVRDTPVEAWQATNVGDLDTYGFDFYSQINLEDNILKKLSLGYTYLNLKKDSPCRFSKYIFDYNRHKAVCMFEFGLKGVAVNLIGNFSNPVSRKRYVTFDLQAEKKIENFILALEGINLLNRNYRELQDIAGPERLVKISIIYTF